MFLFIEYLYLFYHCILTFFVKLFRIRVTNKVQFKKKKSLFEKYSSTRDFDVKTLL